MALLRFPEAGLGNNADAKLTIGHLIPDWCRGTDMDRCLDGVANRVHCLPTMQTPYLSLDLDESCDKNPRMSTSEVDVYLAELEEPQRSALTSLRDLIASIVPEAEQCISYGLPAFRLRGKVIAGFAAFKHHSSYFPHSGSVLEQLGDALDGYETSKGTLRFAVDATLPRELVTRLVQVRIDQAFSQGRS